MATMAGIFKAKGGDFRQLHAVARKSRKSRNRPAKSNVSAATKESKRPTPAQKPERPAPTREFVTFTAGTKFVLSFGAPKERVPEGIQTPPAGGGSATATPEDPNARRFRKVRVDLGGLLSRCTVDRINVREKQNFCRVYVECTVAVGGDGLGPWDTGSYGPFVRKRMELVWERAVVRVVDGCTKLDLRDVCKDAATTKIHFGIEG